MTLIRDHIVLHIHNTLTKKLQQVRNLMLYQCIDMYVEAMKPTISGTDSMHKIDDARRHAKRSSQKENNDCNESATPHDKPQKKFIFQWQT